MEAAAGARGAGNSESRAKGNPETAMVPAPRAYSPARRRTLIAVWG